MLLWLVNHRRHCDLLNERRSAARHVTNTWSYGHITPALKDLHLLPVNLCITTKYKLYLIMHLVHAQQYAWSRVNNHKQLYKGRISFDQ